MTTDEKPDMERLGPKEWLVKVDELGVSVRRFCDDARREDEPAAIDAIADMLDELRTELMEDAQAGIRQRSGRSIKAILPLMQPVAAHAEKSLRRSADSFAWMAAGLRTRLKQARA